MKGGGLGLRGGDDGVGEGERGCTGRGLVIVAVGGRDGKGGGAV